MKIFNESTNALVVTDMTTTNNMIVAAGSWIEVPFGIPVTVGPGGLWSQDTWMTEAVVVHDNAQTSVMVGEASGTWFAHGFNFGIFICIVGLSVLAIRRGLRAGSGQD